MRAHISLVILALTLAASPLRAQDEITLVPQQAWTNLFADAKEEIFFQVKGAKPFEGEITWTFAAENKALLGGRGRAALAGEGKKFGAKVKIQTPPLRDGVILEATLTVRAFQGNKEVALYEKKYFIFPADPFTEMQKILKDLKIHVLDLDKDRRTTKILEALKVPFEEVARAEAMPDVKEGLIIIGEGAMLKDEPALGEALARTLAKGISVLVMAPGEGTLLLPGTKGAEIFPPARRFELRRNDVITQFDKRLDAASWAKDGQVVASSFQIKADDQKVLADAAPNAAGWPWLEVDFGEKKGKLLVSGFGLIRSWEASPTPRYLLARILESLAPAAKEEKDKEK